MNEKKIKKIKEERWQMQLYLIVGNSSCSLKFPGT